MRTPIYFLPPPPSAPNPNCYSRFIDIEEFYVQCDPEKENMCLYGYPNKTWEVALPVEEVPTKLLELVLRINFARDEMNRRDWLTLVTVHSDSCLVSITFYYAAWLNHNDWYFEYGSKEE